MYQKIDQFSFKKYEKKEEKGTLYSNSRNPQQGEKEKASAQRPRRYIKDHYLEETRASIEHSRQGGRGRLSRTTYQKKNEE